MSIYYSKLIISHLSVSVEETEADNLFVEAVQFIYLEGPGTILKSDTIPEILNNQTVNLFLFY